MGKIKLFTNRFFSKDESIIFYSILLINIVFLFATRFYPSLDGPAHLYNSNLIKHLVLKNEFIGDFYQINTLPIPNWTSHFLLASFGMFLPSWLSEKSLLILYVCGMALSFRFLIKTLKPENLVLSIFIFPFIYSFLFHLGFYNYSLSFIFFFLTLTFWVRYYKNNHWSLYLMIGLLLFATYFSNILTYAFLGITLGSTIFLFEAEAHPFMGKDYLRSIGKRIVRLTLGSLPSLLLLFSFFRLVTFPDSTEQYASNELIKWINDVRSLIVFSYSKEEIITEQFFHILVFLFLLGLVLKQNKIRLKTYYPDARQAIAYFSVLLSVVLFFLLPDGSSAGMMSDRLSLMFFILFMILVITQPLPVRVQTLISLIIVFLHLMLLAKHTVTIDELNHRALSIHQTAEHIESNSVILPINLSDNWLVPHFSNYLGVDKPLVILENYEVAVGWFPVRWNPRSPHVQLGEKQSVNGLTWHQNHDGSAQRQIDYIFIYGNLSKRENGQWQELNEIITSSYTLTYQSKDKYIELYRRNF